MSRRRINVTWLAVAALASPPTAADHALAQGSLETVREIHAALRACWVPPQEAAQGKIQVTVRLSFKRNGEVLGAPLIVYENRNASEDERNAGRRAVAATLQRCSPLPLSAALGNIIAGHPINVRLGDGWPRKDRAGDLP
jgi:hypothetical protein